MIATAKSRGWHTCLGMLIAPSVVFFAFTGILQLFGLHKHYNDYYPRTFSSNLAISTRTKS
jgi:hypothetical protein